jgi:hypothetical protein
MEADMETVMKEVSAVGMNLEGMLSNGVQSKLSGDPSSSTPIPDSTAGSAGAQEAAGISSASGTAVAADSSSSGAHAEAVGFDLDALKLSIIAGIRETVQKAFDQAPQLSKEEQAQVLQDLSSDADSLARSLALLDDAGNEADPVSQQSAAQDAQKEGHDNTSQEDQKTNQKNRPSVEEVLKAVEQPMKNGYVRSVGKRGIEYTTKFYAEIIDRMQSRHESSTQAYAAMGFDVEVLGAERAYQAAKHARQRQKEDRLRRTSPAKFNGTLTEAETPGFDELTDEECLAYYQARLIYLQALANAQKKLNLKYMVAAMSSAVTARSATSR